MQGNGHPSEPPSAATAPARGEHGGPVAGNADRRARSRWARLFASLLEGSDCRKPPCLLAFWVSGDKSRAGIPPLDAALPRSWCTASKSSRAGTHARPTRRQCVPARMYPKGQQCNVAAVRFVRWSLSGRAGSSAISLACSLWAAVGGCRGCRSCFGRYPARHQLVSVLRI